MDPIAVRPAVRAIMAPRRSFREARPTAVGEAYWQHPFPHMARWKEPREQHLVGGNLARLADQALDHEGGLLQGMAASQMAALAPIAGNGVPLAGCGPGVTALVSLAQQGSPAQQQAAAGTLASLAAHDANKAIIAKAGGLQPLVTLGARVRRAAHITRAVHHHTQLCIPPRPLVTRPPPQRHTHA